MKATCHLRIGKGSRGLVFGITAKQSASPITMGSYDIPTRQIKLVLDLPDDFFGPDATAEVKVPESAIQIVADVEAPE